MKTSQILLASTLVLAVAAGGYAAFEIGMRRGASMAAPGTNAPTTTDRATQAAASAAPGAVPQSAYSSAKTPPFPIQTHQSFQFKPATGSDPNPPAIPVQTRHRF